METLEMLQKYFGARRFYRTVSMALLMASSAIAGAACSFSFTRYLDTAKAEKEIAVGFTEQTGIAVESVDCPEDVPLEQGVTFECEVVSQTNQKIIVAVTQTDEEGNINWQTNGGLISLVILEPQIQNWIAQQFNLRATVDCQGDRFLIAHTGEQFLCDATAESGQKGRVEVTVQDEQGNVTWTLL